MPKIKLIQEQESEGILNEIYNDLHQNRGKMSEVFKFQSQCCGSIVKHMDLYENLYSRSEFFQTKKEMMAVVVSAANDCYNYK